MKRLNKKIWQGKSAEDCQNWLEDSPAILQLLRSEEMLDSGTNHFYSPVHNAVYEQRYDVIKTMKIMDIKIDVTQLWTDEDQSS